MPGFNSSISNNVNCVFASGADFSGAALPTDANGLQTNGQLWIGSTALNVGGTHINVGTITSPLGTLTIGYSSPNITIDVASGGAVLETLSDDVNTIVTPSSNNIQLVGHVNNALGKFSTVKAGVNLLNINPMSTARWIVDPLGFNGTHTTISSALISASSGETIALLPGTYTENLTLKAGVDIVSYEADAITPNVRIIGNLTATFAGTASISGIRLQTNSAAFLTVSGSAATVINLKNCYLNCSNNVGIVLSSSGGASINAYNCIGDIGTTGISLFTLTSSGVLSIYHSLMTNSGNSLTASTLSNSSKVFIRHSTMMIMITTASTAALDCFDVFFNAGGQNTTIITTAGTAPNNPLAFCEIDSGTASAISIGAGTTVTLTSSVVNSSNTNAITGSGTLNYSLVTFTGSSSTINVTTQNGGIIQGGKFQAPSAGFIGEQIRSAVGTGAAITLSNATPANITSISLTAGIWDVSGLIEFNGTVTGVTYRISISTVSATEGTDGDNSAQTPTSPTASSNSAISIPSYRLTLTATTTVYLVANQGFTVGTLKGFGRISATRVG